MIALNTVSTMTSECFFVKSDTRDTSSTSSALVMLPPVMVAPSQLARLRPRAARGRRLARVLRRASTAPSPVLEVVPQRRAAGACVLLISLPVGAELVGLERANRQPDLPLGRGELDDPHRIGLADLELDLLLAASRVRIVELRHVDQALDALVELDERPEVGQPHDLALD